MPYILNAQNLPPGRRLIKRRGTMGFYRPNQAIARGILPGRSALAGFRGRLGGVRFSRLWQDNGIITAVSPPVETGPEEIEQVGLVPPIAVSPPVETAPEQVSTALTPPAPLPPITAPPGTLIGTVQSATGGISPLIVNPQGIATPGGAAAPTGGISTTWIIAGFGLLAVALLLGGNSGGGRK
jgi:hypothetical protein